MAIEAGGQRFLDRARAPITGERNQQETAPAGCGPDSAGDLVAIDPRQADIDERDVRTKLEQQLHRLQAVLGDRDLMAEILEKELEGLPGTGCVIHDEHAMSV